MPGAQSRLRTQRFRNAVWLPASWQDRLAALQVAEATAVTAAEKFQLKIQIDEAKAKIEEFSR